MKKEICNYLIVIVAITGIYSLCMSLWPEFFGSIILIVIIFLIKNGKGKKINTPLAFPVAEAIKSEYFRKKL